MATKTITAPDKLPGTPSGYKGQGGTTYHTMANSGVGNNVDLSRIGTGNAGAQLRAGNITQEQYNSIMKPTTPAPVSPTDKGSTYTPTSANIATARKAFEGMDYNKQQQFITKNPQFNISQYGFQLKSKPKDLIAPEGEIKVEPVAKVETTQADTNNYQDNSEQRLSEIQTHLSKYYAEQPEVFSTPEQFNAFFKTNQRSDTQKKVLNDFYTAREKERTLMSTPTSDIAKQLVDGTLTDTDLNFLKVSDPLKYTEINQAKIAEQNKLNSKATMAAIAAQAGLGGDSDKNGVLDFMEKPSTPPNIQQTPEMAKANEDYNKLDVEIDDLQTEINAVEKAALEQYKGLSKSQLAAIVRDRSNALIDKRNGKISEAKLISGQISNMNEAYKLQIEQYKLDQDAFKTKIGMFEMMYGMAKDEKDYELKQSQLETGKFSAIADGFGGITVFNTKTGEINGINQTNTDTTNNTPSDGGTPRRIYTEKLGITQDTWNGASDADKNTMIDKMYKQEGGGDSKALVNRINNPAALTRPGSKEIQDYLISMGAEKRTNPNKVNGKNYTYAKFKTMEQGRAAIKGYIDKFGLNTGGTKSSSPINTPSQNLGYQEQYSNYYQQNLDGKMDFKTAKLSGYTGTPEQFTREAEAYRVRTESALKSVGVDKDRFDLKVLASIAKVPVSLQDKTISAIYNLIVKNPSLAKPENEGKLWTEVTSSQQPSKALIDGVALLSKKRLAVTDAKANTRQNWAAYEGDEGTISNILPRLGTQAGGVVGDFLSQRKAVGQIIAKLIENGRLSDADRTFYQGLLPKLNTPTYQDGVNKLDNIRATFLGQGAPGTAGGYSIEDDGL